MVVAMVVITERVWGIDTGVNGNVQLKEKEGREREKLYSR
jgi:hypothetical protein